MKMKRCRFFITSALVNSEALEVPLEVFVGCIHLEGKGATGDGWGR